MTFKQKVVIKILLLVARMLADNEWQKEVENLSTHIQHGDGGILRHM